MRRPLLLTSLAATALVALMVAAVVTAVDHARREKEWAHGGDAVTVTVDYRVAGKDDTTEAARALVWPADVPRVMTVGDQALVVRVAWAGAPGDGRFELIGLDRRSSPPRFLRPRYGQDATGHVSIQWGSHLNALAERYDWLAGIKPANHANGESWSEHPWAVGAPAATRTVMAVFDLGQNQQPSQDPARDLMLALVYTQDGGVRWAKQVPLSPTG